MDQSDLIEIGIDATPEQHVKRLAALAKSSGMDGVVCSAQESSMLSADLGKDSCFSNSRYSSYWF